MKSVVRYYLNLVSLKARGEGGQRDCAVSHHYLSKTNKRQVGSEVSFFQMVH